MTSRFSCSPASIPKRRICRSRCAFRSPPISTCPSGFAPDTPLSASKSYLDLKHAATTSLPKDVHFTLIEGVAEHIADTVFAGDARVQRVEIRIVKLAIAENGESIGITLVRHRR